MYVFQKKVKPTNYLKVNPYLINSIKSGLLFFILLYKYWVLLFFLSGKISFGYNFAPFLRNNSITLISNSAIQAFKIGVA